MIFGALVGAVCILWLLLLGVRRIYLSLHSRWQPTREVVFATRDLPAHVRIGTEDVGEEIRKVRPPHPLFHRSEVVGRITRRALPRGAALQSDDLVNPEPVLPEESDWWLLSVPFVPEPTPEPGGRVVVLGVKKGDAALGDAEVLSRQAIFVKVQEKSSLLALPLKEARSVARYLSADLHLFVLRDSPPSTTKP